MNFFDSEIVKNELREINNLQELIYKNVFKFPSMEKDEKLEHINILQKLLDKQKILYTRLKLTEDPEAIKLKAQIEDYAILMGMPKGLDMNIIFNNMSSVIQSMKDYLERA